MATVPPVQSLYRLVLNQTWGATIQVRNTLHVFSRGFTPLAAQVGQDFVTAILPTWRGGVGSGLVFNSVLVEQFLPDPNDRTIVQIGQAGTSQFPTGNAAIAQPCVLALVITWRSAFPGKRGRGRMYHAGQWAWNSDGIHWKSNNLETCESLASTIRNHYIALNNAYALELCVFSRSMGGRVPPYTADGVHPVVAHTVQTAYSTMGSRRLGRGL